MARSIHAFIAANRFGLGARPGDLNALQRDPRGWLEMQVDGSRGLPPELGGLASAASQLEAFFRIKEEKGRKAAKEERKRQRKAYGREARLRTLAAIRSEAPFHERLVTFWSNHFTVAVGKPIMFGIAGAFEREAIRPHVTGRFADMLLAVTRHPAMLFYLDNFGSIGPNSPAGRARDRGLNENLAREILELHTLGVAGGYDQDDVGSLARMLTGWSLARSSRDPAPLGTFYFRSRAHEPGTKSLLGRRFGEAGVGEAEEALQMLAAHPATSRHLAFKMARHFLADEPPALAVERLDRVYRETGGNLGAMAHALIHLDEAWEAPLAKLKTPQDLVVSTLRAIGFKGKGRRPVSALRLLGQYPWTAPSPAGWPDTAPHWAGADAVLKRIEFALAVAQRVGGKIDPRRLEEATIGPVAAATTTDMIARAASGSDGHVLLFTSPEFQRR